MPDNLNYGDRTPEDICLLCRRNTEESIANSNATNSHFTPMGMIQSNTGRRNYETTVTINLGGGETHQIYYGRSNLQNDNPEIGDDPHTADYIFCQECEDKLAEVEGLMIDVLNRKLRHPNHNQNFPTTVLSETVSFKECRQVDSLKFKLFIYSIIWRQNLQQQLEFNGQGILKDATEEKLRLAVVSGLYDGTEDNELLHNCFPFSIITAIEFSDTTKHHISPHVKKNYPEVFCVNEYLVMMYDQNELDNEEEMINRAFFGIPQDAFNEALDNNGNELIRIGFISNEAFENIQNLTWKEVAEIKFDNIGKDEFMFALQNSFPGLNISRQYLSLDRGMNEGQRNFGGAIINMNANWINVQNRPLVRYKLIQHTIPNRNGIRVPVYAGIIEILNDDGNRYQRLGFYGNID